MEVPKIPKEFLGPGRAIKMHIKISNSLAEIVKATEKEKSPKSRGKYFKARTYMHDGFLIIAGLYQEAKLGMNDYLSLHYSDRRERNFLTNLFCEVFGELPGDRRKPTPTKPFRRQITYCCNQVLNVLRELTENNSLPPYELLNSEERKRLYLRGFLYRGVSISHTTRKVKTTGLLRKLPLAFIYSFPKKIELVRKIGNMLREFSIRFTECSEGLYSGNLGSLNRMLSLELLNPLARDKLEGLLEDYQNYWNSPELTLSENADFPRALNALGRKKRDEILERRIGETDE